MQPREAAAFEGWRARAGDLPGGLDIEKEIWGLGKSLLGVTWGLSHSSHQAEASRASPVPGSAGIHRPWPPRCCGPVSLPTNPPHFPSPLNPSIKPSYIEIQFAQCCFG